MLDQPWRHEQWYWRYLANALASSPQINSTRKNFKTSSGTAPCVFTLCLPDITACDQISQAFLLRICILQANKYWRWERSGKPPSLPTLSPSLPPSLPPSFPPTFFQIFLLTSLPPSSSPPLSLHPSLLLPPPTGPWRIVWVYPCRYHRNKPLDAPEEVPGVDAVEGRESLKWSLTGWVLTAGKGMGYTCGLIVQ